MKTTRRSRRMARQLFQLCLVDGKLDPERVRHVARRLASSSERGSLAVLSSVQRLVRLDRTQHRALIESAAPLSEEEQRSVLAEVARRHGTDLEVAVALNPALIGGLRITVGSTVYDGSVRGRLDALERQF